MVRITTNRSSQQDEHSNRSQRRHKASIFLLSDLKESQSENNLLAHIRAIKQETAQKPEIEQLPIATTEPTTEPALKLQLKKCDSPGLQNQNDQETELLGENEGEEQLQAAWADGPEGNCFFDDSLGPKQVSFHVGRGLVGEKQDQQAEANEDGAPLEEYVNTSCNSSFFMHPEHRERSRSAFNTSMIDTRKIEGVHAERRISGHNHDQQREASDQVLKVQNRTAD